MEIRIRFWEFSGPTIAHYLLSNFLLNQEKLSLGALLFLVFRCARCRSSELARDVWAVLLGGSSSSFAFTNFHYFYEPALAVAHPEVYATTSYTGEIFILNIFDATAVKRISNSRLEKKRYVLL